MVKACLFKDTAWITHRTNCSTSLSVLRRIYDYNSEDRRTAAVLPNATVLAFDEQPSQVAFSCETSLTTLFGSPLAVAEGHQVVTVLLLTLDARCKMQPDDSADNPTDVLDDARSQFSTHRAENEVRPQRVCGFE